MESVDLSALFPDMSPHEFEKAKRDLFADTASNENSAEEQIVLNTPSESSASLQKSKELEEPLIVTDFSKQKTVSDLSRLKTVDSEL